MVYRTISYLFTIFTLLALQTFGQITTQTYASGLTNPIGLTIDGTGNLWVAEQGTGNDDSRISIITPDGMVHPFLINLPSEIVQGNPIGAEHVQFDIDGKLLIVQGEGADSLSESILVVDTTGFTPGDPQLTIADIEAVYNIGDYSIGQGGVTSNPFRLIIGPNDDWYISDAGFNGIIKRERNSGTLSVFTQLGEVVSTGLVYTGTNFYLGSLTGFPFPLGGANIYEVDLNGNNNVFQSGLTMVIDLAIDPLDDKLLALQYGEFSGGFQNNSGALFNVTDTSIDTLIYGLNFPAGMVFNSSGELFITSFADDEVIKVTGIPVGVKYENNSAPGNFVLRQNYPNPFNPSTKISWQSPVSSHQTLKVYDLLGREVATLVDEYKPAGKYEVDFDTSNLSSGTYFYSLQSGEFTSTKKLVLIK
jgi:hypothetical protein